MLGRSKDVEEKSSGLIRSVTARLRRYMDERRAVLGSAGDARKQLPFIITPRGTNRVAARSLRDAPSLVGHTRELSETGLTLLLPSVRAGDAYLTDGETRLEVRLELPGGPVTMQAACVRFDHLQRQEFGCSYLLRVRIVEMQKSERERYLAYLKTVRKGGSARDGRQPSQVAAASSNGSNGKAQAGAWDALTPASVSKAFEQFLRD